MSGNERRMRGKHTPRDTRATHTNTRTPIQTTGEIEQNASFCSFWPGQHQQNEAFCWFLPGQNQQNASFCWFLPGQNQQNEGQNQQNEAFCWF